MTLIDFLFLKLRTLKAKSDKFLKSAVWEDPSTNNMTNIPKHCWNLHHRTLIVFNSHWQVDGIGKSPSYWNAKSAGDEKYPVLNRDNLTVPIQMQFSKKQKNFSLFISAFLKLRLNFKHFQKKDDPQSFCISDITDSENVVRSMSSLVSEHPLTSNMVNVTKHCWNMHHSTIIIFIDHCQVDWGERVSLIDMQDLGTAC